MTPVDKQAHDRTWTTHFYISSSNQLLFLCDDGLVPERAVMAYLLETGESVDEWESAFGGVRGERAKGKAKRRYEEEVGSHASLLALFSCSEVFP